MGGKEVVIACVAPPMADVAIRRDKTLHKMPEWAMVYPAPDKLAAEHTPGIVTKENGEKLLFLGFDKRTPWEQLTGNEKIKYGCVDCFGKMVEVGPKNKQNHTSWDDVQSDPTFHYNLATILARPDEIYPDQSQNPQALNHWKDGVVLNFVKHGYVKNLDTPLTRRAGREYAYESTIVSVKYCNDGSNYTLTSVVHRIPPTKKIMKGLE